MHFLTNKCFIQRNSFELNPFETIFHNTIQQHIVHIYNIKNRQK